MCPRSLEIVLWIRAMELNFHILLNFLCTAILHPTWPQQALFFYAFFLMNFHQISCVDALPCWLYLSELIFQCKPQDFLPVSCGIKIKRHYDLSLRILILLKLIESLNKFMSKIRTIVGYCFVPVWYPCYPPSCPTLLVVPPPPLVGSEALPSSPLILRIYAALKKYRHPIQSIIYSNL